MKRMKKFLSLGLASVMALSMVACGSSAETTAESKPAESTAAETPAETTADAPADTTADAGAADYEECTIRFDWWGGDARHEATLAAVDAFMAKYPGITVEVNYGAWTDWETARALEYQSGTGADVTQIGSNWIADYDADGSTFIDLNTVSDVLDLSQWDQQYLDMCKDSKGGQAAIPVSMTGRIFYWDKTTFDEAGIAIPTSVEELKAAGQTFKEVLGDDYYPLALGQYDRMILMTFWYQSNYGKEIIAADGTLNATLDELKAGLEFIQSLEDAHAIPSIKTIDGDAAASFDVNEKFISGKYAGILEWDSAPGKYISALGDARELVVGEEFTDLGGADTGVFTKVSMALAITSTSEHPREAAMLVNYLMNDAEGVSILGTQRGVPQSKVAYDTLKAADALDPVIAEAHEKVLAASKYSFSPKFDDASLKGDTSAYADVFGGLSYGDYSVDDAAQVLYDAMSAVCN